MKKIFFTVVFILVCSSINAQNYEFGKVSENEILQKEHPNDSEASAAFLYKKGKVSLQYIYGWKYVYDFEARIKIYNQQGYDYATIEIPLYRVGAGNNEIFSNFRGFTLNMEGGKSTRDRVRNSDMFDDDVNEFWDIKKITFPNVKEGSVIEFSYRITSPYTRSLPEFEFQGQMPVDFAEYTMEIPEYLGYKINSKGFFPLQQISNRELKEFTFVHVPTQRPGASALGSQRTERDVITQTQTTTVYTAKNVAKIIQEEYVNNFRNYITSIKPELEWVRMPRSALTTYSTTWDDIAKDAYKRRSFGGELDAKNYFETDLQAVLNSASTPTEKTIAVFDFVKQHMSWNGNYSSFTNKGVKDAYKDRTGNVGEINLMLTAMLRHAGLNANPVLVSTKSNGIPLFPTSTGFNYVISAVEIGNQTILLDATNPYSTPNVLPERTLNWFGRLIRKDETTQQVGLMPSTLSRTVVNLEVNVNSNSSINGRYRSSLTDHRALAFRTKYATIPENTYVQELEKKFGDLEIDDYSIQNKTDAYKPIVESYRFSKENAYEIIGDKLYINPLFFLSSNQNPFTAEKREYPIDFSFASSSAYMINLTIPEGYNVESIPESEVYQLPDGLGEFRFMISNTGTNIQLRVTSDINIALVPSDYYESLKEYYAAMIAKQNEKIVLVKI